MTNNDVIICTECKAREWSVYGCINNDNETEEICLFCCKCPEHEEYWGDLCCEHEYYENYCACCSNQCEKCRED